MNGYGKNCICVWRTFSSVRPLIGADYIPATSMASEYNGMGGAYFESL